MAEDKQYDSRTDTLNHIHDVRKLLERVINNLRNRAIWHDASKLESPEKEAFDVWTPKLRATTYGSDEYKEALASLGAALQHHYQCNSHHPEHFENGVADMTIIDLIEMLCDWSAATQRHADGDLASSIEHNITRFGIEPQLASILRNSAEYMGWFVRKETEREVAK